MFCQLLAFASILMVAGPKILREKLYKRESCSLCFELGRQSFFSSEDTQEPATGILISGTFLKAELANFTYSCFFVWLVGFFWFGLIFFFLILNYLPTFKYWYISHEMTRVLSSLEKIEHYSNIGFMFLHGGNCLKLVSSFLLAGSFRHSLLSYIKPASPTCCLPCPCKAFKLPMYCTVLCKEFLKGDFGI